ncbi:hypothetical protein KP509_05G081100 [Ceratopteris richardii]|nr:hypothetical protein KP509_05G081100 [Ceratopteris richardii]
MAVECLRQIPPFHNRFSLTSSYRRFICIIEKLFVYCAILDESLSKAQSFKFLESIRDSFMVVLQQKNVSANVSLKYHAFQHEMRPTIKRFALPLVGVPEREKARIREEELRLAQGDAGNEIEVNSPSAVVPLTERNSEEIDLNIEEKHVIGGSQSSLVPLIGHQQQEKKEVDYQRCGIKFDGMEIMQDGSNPSAHAQSNRDRWRRQVIIVIILDVAVCLVFLVIWLGVCHGVKCL